MFKLSISYHFWSSKLFLIILLTNFFFSVNSAIVFTGAYWKMISIWDQEKFMVVSAIFIGGVNLITYYISIIYMNIVSRNYVVQLLRVNEIHNVMANIGIPFSHSYLFRSTMNVTALFVPPLSIILLLNFTLAEIMCVVYPYFIRIMYMSSAAQILGGALGMAALYRKPLKNLKKYEGEYTIDEQIHIILTTKKLMWMFQDTFKDLMGIYDVLLFINIYANSLEMAFTMGYIYIYGLQDTSLLWWLALYIPGNIINLYVYTAFDRIDIRVSKIIKLCIFNVYRMVDRSVFLTFCLF